MTPKEPTNKVVEWLNSEADAASNSEWAAALRLAAARLEAVEGVSAERVIEKARERWPGIPCIVLRAIVRHDKLEQWDVLVYEKQRLGPTQGLDAPTLPALLELVEKKDDA